MTSSTSAFKQSANINDSLVESEYCTEKDRKLINKVYELFRKLLFHNLTSTIEAR